MRWETRVLTVGVTSLAMIAGLAVPGAAQSSGEAPKATEIGVTAKEIHIAVVADVDTPLSPGLFMGGVDGVKAAAAYLNSKAGGGGVAGRRLVVDFYDSKLNATESRNATIQACGNDLAMVGTEALFLTQVEDMVGCKDEAGGAVGLPDLGAVVTSTQQRCAPISFPITGTAVDCATLDDPEQTYYGNQGEAKWLLSQHKNDLHGPIVIGNDVKNDVPLAQAKTLQLAGITPEQGFDRRRLRTGSAKRLHRHHPTDEVRRIELRHDGLGRELDAADAQRSDAPRPRQLEGRLGHLLRVRQRRGDPERGRIRGPVPTARFPPVRRSTFEPNADGLPAIREEGGRQARPVLGLLMGCDARVRPGRQTRCRAERRERHHRESLLTGIRSLNDFNAGGMVGTKSFKSGRGTHCFVEVRFTNGKWVRQYPSKMGTFDCKPANAVEFKAKFTQ